MLWKSKPKTAKTFLQRLGSNTAGNTLAMAAMALFPIVGLVGGGVDIGRAYMAKARLQQACDAGALAARRNMTQDTMTSADLAEAQKFFDFNFPEGSFESTDFDETVTDSNGKQISANKLIYKDGSDARVVDGEAQTTIKTTMMRIFNFEHMVIKVNCTSRLDVGNVDVMMVLDVTGSMANTVTDGGTRLEALQGAVEDFYNILGPGGGTSGEQIRYGFVPYTSTVNVGRILYEANPQWLVGGSFGDRATYSTRTATWEVPDFDHPDYSRTETNEYFTQLNQVDGPECTDRYAENLPFGGSYFDESDDAYGNPWITSESRSGNTLTRVSLEYEYESWNGSTNPPPSYAVGSSYWLVCVRKVTEVTEVIPIEIVDKWEPGATMVSSWTYGEQTHDTFDYVRSIDPNNPAAQNPTVDSLLLNRWDGCIEERDTVHISATASSIPSGAMDMDIDTVPTDAASRWRPFWRQVTYNDVNTLTNATNGFAPCPTEARRLAEYTEYGRIDENTFQPGSLGEYIDSLQANGGTNHTIGMIWGARLLSEDGLFATENASSGNGFSIGRHMLFMTDGQIDIRPNNYGSFRLNNRAAKIAPTSATEADLEAIQANRFQLMCAAARAKGWTIWVVQFGVTEVTQNMKDCASTEAHATPASNAAELEAAFSGIAQKIGGLRLSN